MRRVCSKPTAPPCNSSQADDAPDLWAKRARLDGADGRMAPSQQPFACTTGTALRQPREAPQAGRPADAGRGHALVFDTAAAAESGQENKATHLHLWSQDGTLTIAALALEQGGPQYAAAVRALICAIFTRSPPSSGWHEASNTDVVASPRHAAV
jgi:hypothetical protein